MMNPHPPKTIGSSLLENRLDCYCKIPPGVNAQQMTKIDQVVADGWSVLRAAWPALPKQDELNIELTDAEAAQARQYYLPDEDERLREVYTRYLAARSSLWEMVRTLRPHLRSEDLRVFALAFCAAAALMRSADFILTLTKDRPVVWKKLDEAEPRYGLPAKSFTRIYRNISSPKWMWRYRQGRGFYEAHRAEIHAALREGGLSEMIRWLEQEEPHFPSQKRTFFTRFYEYRLYSFLRRSGSGYRKVMFSLFRLGGSAIADMRQPFVKPIGAQKKVSAEVRETTRNLLRPGDVFVTRHEDAMSNLFLPGYWPHAALYLGTPEERLALGIRNDGDTSATVLEAKKDGVKFRQLSETLAVDSFVVVRPRISKEELAEALTRAMTHEGKLYDFVFDFRKADRLVCTEVVYRAYHGVGGMDFELSKRSGRLVLSAEDFLRQGLAKDLFEVILTFGVGDNVIRHGDSARSRLKATLR